MRDEKERKEYGFFKNSIWIPFPLFIPKLHYEKLLSFDRIVIHCSLSQARAPQCARKLDPWLPHTKIFVLGGGFMNWISDEEWKNKYSNLLE